MEKRYAWDVIGSETFPSRKVVIVEQISTMVTRGFEIKEMRIKLKQLKTLK
jgi:hypothetical protein